MTTSILWDIVTPPLPLVIIHHFLATTPLTTHVTRDKTAYDGLLTIMKALYNLWPL